MSTLIVDAGSTKMEWVLTEKGKVLQHFDTQGFNPNYAEESLFSEILAGLQISHERLLKVYYYGSGCGAEANRQLIMRHLAIRFPKTEVEVGTDMLGAARALLGHQQGIACILGTGANSCLYDGNAISESAVSLGYLVGDEGSGCYIGRKLVRAYFYDLMPLELKLEFEKVYKLNIKDFIDRVYHQPEASKYLASFTKFAGKHQGHPFIRQLVGSCFDDFIEVFVLRYANCHTLPIGFVGSVAYHFQGILKERLEIHGLQLGTVIVAPMEGLIKSMLE